MAAVKPLPGAALIKVEVAFTGDWSAATPTYTDVTADLRLSDGITWSRGRSDEFQTISPGTCSFTLGDRARTYDVTTNANMVPARPLLVTCYYPTTSTVYKQFDGCVEDWAPDWPDKTEAVVKADAMERYGKLAASGITKIGSAPSSATARLGLLADYNHWPAGARSFAADVYTLLGGTGGWGDASDALAAMSDIASSQTQILYQTRDGVLKTLGMFTASSTNQGTFGDAAGELPFVSLEDGVGGGYLYTSVHLTCPGGFTTTQPPPPDTPDSVFKALGSPYLASKFGANAYKVEIAKVTEATAQTACDSIATSLTAKGFYRIKQIQVRPLANPASLFPVVLNCDLGNPITVKHQPVGGGSRITQTAVIQSIQHDISDRDWVVTWGLAPP